MIPGDMPLLLIKELHGMIRRNTIPITDPMLSFLHKDIIKVNRKKNPINERTSEATLVELIRSLYMPTMYITLKTPKV